MSNMRCDDGSANRKVAREAGGGTYSKGMGWARADSPWPPVSSC